MAIANIQSIFRHVPDTELLEVIITFATAQNGNTVELSTRGFTQYATNPILSIEEYSAIPATGANLLTTNLATLSGLSLLINNSSTRLIRIVGR